jgi:GDP-L-fucose synthase
MDSTTGTQAAPVVYPLAGKRVWVAGHTGMVGSALVRRLTAAAAQPLAVGRGAVDLRRQSDVEAWMLRERPQAVFVAAATVGGILANDTRPAEFIYDNLAIEANIIHGAHLAGVEKLMFLGSSCIYPKFADQPIVEDSLLTGAFEPTNQWYATAKVAGIKLCQAYRRQYGCDFISVMPTNLYGPGDNFDPLESHVVPGLIGKTHAAKLAHMPSLPVWGTGNARRELLYVEDAADAMVFLMQRYSGEEIVNLGSGQEIRIADLATLIARIVDYPGLMAFDRSMPDGTPRKIVDVSRLAAMGWWAPTPLEEGLKRTYLWYLDNVATPQRRSAAG